MANRFRFFILVFSTVTATLESPSIPSVIKLNVRNDSSSSLNVPWNDGGKVPAPETTTVSTRTSPSSFDCGVANLRMDPVGNEDRIVGGVQSFPNEFPWQSFVIVETSSGKISYCGGSLIDDRWILTTARCVSIPGETVRYLSVYLGAHDITASYEANRRLYNGYEIYIHPEWNPTTMAGDIAMIKLATIVTYTQYIRPVCLASSSEPSYDNSQVTVAGWGTTSDGSSKLSPVLREVTVPVISNSQCSSFYGALFITNKVMCTNGVLNRGPCNGDSGGPLIYQQTNGRWKQIGIISFVSNLGCQMGYPYGYTRLSSYSNWVYNIMSSYSNSVSTTPSPSSGSSLSAFLSLVLISLSLIM